MKKINCLLGIVFFAITVFSCKKEEKIEPLTPETAACQVNELTDGKDFSIAFQYNTDNRLSRFDYFDISGKLEDYAIYEYNGNGKISKLSYCNPANTLTGYISYEYNSDNAMTKENHYVIDGSTATLKGYTSFQYSTEDKRMNKLSYFDVAKNYSTMYMNIMGYDGRGNITEVRYGDINGLIGSKVFTYSDKKNPRLSLGGFLYGYDVEDITNVSPNTVTKIIAKDAKGNVIAEGASFAYEFNENGFPTEETVVYEDEPGVTHVTNYKFNCK